MYISFPCYMYSREHVCTCRTNEILHLTLSLSMKRRLALYHERRNHSRSARKVPLSLLLFGSILGTNRRPCPSRVRSIVNKCKTSYIDRAVRGDLLRRSPRSPVVFLQYGMRRSSTSSFHWRDCGSLSLSLSTNSIYILLTSFSNDVDMEE